LKELQELTYLNLQHTKVSDTGFREIKKALPKCKID
jgi:hypothetical protein